MDEVVERKRNRMKISFGWVTSLFHNARSTFGKYKTFLKEYGLKFFGKCFVIGTIVTICFGSIMLCFFSRDQSFAMMISMEAGEVIVFIFYTHFILFREWLKGEI
jgi:hypothetical protein